MQEKQGGRRLRGQMPPAPAPPVFSFIGLTKAPACFIAPEPCTRRLRLAACVSAIVAVVVAAIFRAVVLPASLVAGETFALAAIGVAVVFTLAFDDQGHREQRQRRAEAVMTAITVAIPAAITPIPVPAITPVTTMAAIPAAAEAA